MESGLWNTVIAHDVSEIIRDPTRLISVTLLTGKKATLRITDVDGNDFVIAHINEARPTANISNIIVEPEFQLAIKADKDTTVDVLGQLEIDEVEQDMGSDDEMNSDEEMMEFDMDEISDEDENDEDEREAILAAVAAEAAKRAKKIPEAPKESKKVVEVVKKQEPPKKQEAPKKVEEAPKKQQEQTKKDKKKKDDKKPAKPLDNSVEKKAAEAALAVIAGPHATEEKAQKRPASEATKGSAAGPKVLSLSGGVKAEIIKAGNGNKEVSKGSHVAIRYVGSLAKNGKVFDKGNFDLKVGKGDSIKGFEVGVMGAVVGETRKVFIPAAMGYGKQKAGPIPPNSDLIFEMTVTKVN